MTTIRFNVCVLLAFLFLKSVANSDLIVSKTTLTSSSSLSIYDRVKLVTTIKNIGSVSCGSSYTKIYLSKDTLFSDNEVIGLISTPFLAADDANSSNFIYTLPQTITSFGNYYIGYKVDATNLITELNESNYFVNYNSISISPIQLTGLTIPYPIIFIHGLNSNSETWKTSTHVYDSLLSYKFGGTMHFCLNYDNNIYTSNLSTDYYDFTKALNEVNLTAADYYQVNFSIDYNGNTTTPPITHQSNQSAINKQAVAVRDAINHVLRVTGASKVVLVGHSMGGLAERNYLANSNLWQTDNQHHVAKLFTVGTPHGGSNLTAGVLNNILLGVDGGSEACRDLRYSSSFLNFYGKFLFGGQESATANGNFNNDDINCDGTIGGAVVGLNNKSLPSDLPYACYIATESALGGDGVVDAPRANLNNYGLANNTHTITADTLIDDEFSFSECHTKIVQRFSKVIRGIDEPNTFAHSYEIEKNKLISALINKVELPTISAFDYDYFYFNQIDNEPVFFDFTNLHQLNFQARIYNSAKQLLATYGAASVASITNSLILNAGKYYIEVTAQHSSDSWKYPYYIYVGSTSFFNSNNDNDNINDPFEITVFPNPASDYIDIKLINLYDKAETTTVTIIDVLGKECYREAIQHKASTVKYSVNLSNYEAGIYFINAMSNNRSITKKIIITK